MKINTTYYTGTRISDVVSGINEDFRATRGASVALSLLSNRTLANIKLKNCQLVKAISTDWIYRTLRLTNAILAWPSGTDFNELNTKYITHRNLKNLKQ